MFAFFRALVEIAIPIFVLSTMLNVGLTQPPAQLLRYLRNRRYVLKMVVANFLFAPLLMILLLRLTSLELPFQAGLLVFAFGAGAPFLIKLTRAAEHDIALGAATMLLLVVITVAFMPLVLPRVLHGMPVDAGAMTSSLLRMMIAPMGVGMMLAHIAPRFVERVQPWVGKTGNISLAVVIATTLIGYYPAMLHIVGSGAILTGLAFILGAFGIGYLAGGGKDDLQDVGGLGTAQRNTAAALTVAAQNFSDPIVLVVITLVSTVGVVVLLGIARALRDDGSRPSAVNR